MSDQEKKMIRVTLPGHVMQKLERDAQSRGEPKVQTVIRQILAKWCQEDTSESKGASSS